VHHNADLFTAEAGERLAGHLHALLTAALADPDRPLSRLSLLTAAERDTVLGPGPGAPPRETVVDLFARQVAARPHATALSAPPVEHRYAELDAETNQLARYLLRRGVRRDEPVAVFLPRGPELIMAMLAILKAGGAYLALDPAHPDQRIRAILTDSGARLALTGRRLAPRLPEALDRLLLDAAPAELTAERTDAPDIVPAPDDLAYISYTSGSTGTPKGVAVTHRNVARLVTGLDDALIGPGDTMLALAPAAFDASTFEVWNALCRGARLAIHPDGPVGPRELGAEVNRLGVTTLWLTAQLGNMVADLHPRALAGVRLLVTGGEALSGAHLRKLFAAVPGLRIVNGYGPTETTTFATTHPVDPARLGSGSVPIGRPVGGTRCHLVGPDDEPVPLGVVGELLVSGFGVARGYLGRPGQTARVFTPDPYGPPGSRLYRTGDLARRHADGTLEFVGRVDDQVKVRGFRIEPGEVRALLLAHPDVRDAFVQARGEGVRAALVAYVVGTAEPAAVRAYLMQRLPAALVPATFVAMDRLPMTPNGKVDHRALPEPAAARPAEGHDAPPEERWERIVADVWAEVLGQRPASTADDFFALGGTSYGLLRVADAFAERYGVVVELPELFLSSGLGATAAALRAAAPTAVTASDHR
jgi:amino acid adenylation domain-containing protein